MLPGDKGSVVGNGLGASKWGGENRNWVKQSETDIQRVVPAVETRRVATSANITMLKAEAITGLWKGGRAV